MSHHAHFTEVLCMSQARPLSLSRAKDTSSMQKRLVKQRRRTAAPRRAPVAALSGTRVGLFNERVTHGWRAEREWG
eukprot:3235759-Rhodomonas_salina.2